MKEIFIDFTIPNNHFFPIVSWIIRILQWKRGLRFRDVPSHVRYRWFDKYHEVWWVYEASKTSVHMSGQSQFNNQKVLKTYKYEISPETKKDFVRYVNENVNKSYGFLQLIGLIFVVVFKRVGLKVSNPFADGNYTEVCVETVARGLKDVISKSKVFKNVKFDSIDLCDLMNLILCDKLKGEK
ncbi:MAG: hypothetical protein R3213_13500 [Flavobacteriaceae bacterium]|nr:hypothetical protein [Flavobacteriaceae bacterium]